MDYTTTHNSLSVTINQSQLSDAGTLYECFSANSIGNTTVGFNLTVRGHSLTHIFAYTHAYTHSHMFTHTYTCTHTDKPDAVDNETIRHEHLSLVVARITWDAPADNNAEITGYTLTVTETLRGECEVVMTTEMAANVYLAPNKTYTVTVVCC